VESLLFRWRESHLEPWENPSLALDFEENLASSTAFLGPPRGGGETAFVHVWRHPRAVVLGQRDKALPRLDQAVQWLKREGFSVALRASGGTAVPLDGGVLNVTLIVPVWASPRIEKGFTDLSEMVMEWLRPFAALERGKIEGSYCPGDYDLSCRGRKVAGMAQRRKAKAVILTMFLNVEGSGERRGEWMRRFYETAGGDGKSQTCTVHRAVRDGFPGRSVRKIDFGGNGDPADPGFFSPDTKIARCWFPAWPRKTRNYAVISLCSCSS
jgi:lipoate-protein ligase A